MKNATQAPDSVDHYLFEVSWGSMNMPAKQKIILKLSVSGSATFEQFHRGLYVAFQCDDSENDSSDDSEDDSSDDFSNEEGLGKTRSGMKIMTSGEFERMKAEKTELAELSRKVTDDQKVSGEALAAVSGKAGGSVERKRGLPEPAASVVAKRSCQA